MRFPALLLLAILSVGANARAADVAQTIVDPYLRIQTALADDKLDGVKADSIAIATEAAKLGAVAAPLVDSARKMEGAATLEAAREAFGDLSQALIGYAEATRSSLGAGVAIAYCPMAQKSWAQRGKELTNPYYGKAMLMCGEFKKPAQ
jgi:hypothetical protein